MANDQGYVNPDVLVTTQWVVDNLDNPDIQIAEASEDVLLYEIGHIPGAVKFDWHEHLQHPVWRDFIDEDGFNELLSSYGITPDTTIVFYGDNNNWWAAYAYWFFKYRGHDKVKIMNGGRQKWEAEGRSFTREVPAKERSNYTGATTRLELRAYRDDVLKHIGYEGGSKVADGKPLVDVRSPGEYSGETLHMPNYPQEGAQRGGHIPGAASIPWAQAVAEDNTFKSADQLRELYEGKGIMPDSDIVVYCRIGERSSHTWFVLHELLGYPNVRNYDGSWTEWGNVIQAPIEKG